MDPSDLSVTELLRGFASGEVTPVDVVGACWDKAAMLDPLLDAYMTPDHAGSMAQAETASQRWLQGTARTLEGVPFGIKDVIQASGLRCTAGSRALAEHTARVDATVVRRLQDHGAILMGSMRTFEFACGPNTVTHNPWDLTRWPGGSSSGSAVAVAASMLPLALGTDTAGSVVTPASFCGVFGLKPTYGRVPRTGVIPVSWSLDHVGFFARDVDDLSTVLAVISGFDPDDPTSSPQPAFRDPEQGLDLSALRVGLPTDWYADQCDHEILAERARIADWLASQGAQVREVCLPATRTVDPESVATTIINAELGAIHEGELEISELFGSEFLRLLARSRFISATDYIRALRSRALFQNDVDAAFRETDILLLPGSNCHAPRSTSLAAEIDGMEVPLGEVILRHAVIQNLTGIPSLAVPTGLDAQGLPIGIQIACPSHAEGRAIQVARALRACPGVGRRQGTRPPLVEQEAIRAAGEKRAPVRRKEVDTTIAAALW